MAVELVSFRLCPFVQRSVITLLEKGVEHTLTYIDLAQPPDWFLAVSPFGKVPVLRTEARALFESAVINEYLDEVHPPSLHPAAPLEKAVNRAWIEFGSELIMKQYGLSIAADDDAFEENRHQILKGLRQLEQQLEVNGAGTAGPWFNGGEYSLVETAYAPLFQRFALLEAWYPLDLFEGLPRVTAWHEALLERPSTKASVIEAFAQEWQEYIRASGGYGAEVYGGP